MLNLTERAEGDVTTIVLHGRMDLFGAAVLETALLAIGSEGKRDVVLDMAAVDYISSAGVRTLAEAVARSRDGGPQLRLVGMNARVQRVLRITGLEEFFASYQSRTAALAVC
jgi:anti-sigma B factor antagonist